MVVFYSDERVQNELWVQERGKNIDKGSMRAEVKRGNRMCGSPRSPRGAPHASARVTPRFCSGLFAPFQSRENFNQHQTRLRSAQAWPGCCLVTRPGPSMEDLGQSGAGHSRVSPNPHASPKALPPPRTSGAALHQGERGHWEASRRWEAEHRDPAFQTPSGVTGSWGGSSPRGWLSVLGVYE